VNYKTFFKEKKIAVIGLGPHGEMVADIKFLIRFGAAVSFYDVRSENRLQGYLAPLREAGLTDFTFGKLPEDQILSADLILLSPEISRKSFFLKKAIQAGIQIEYPEILFLKLAPPITLIGVMGECGKSTVAQMIYSILKPAFAEYESQGLFFTDPNLPNGALTHLKKIKGGDVVLARIPEEMTGEYHAIRMSPHVAVITSPISSYGILEYQTYNNFIVAPNSVVDAMKTAGETSSKAKILRTKDDNAAFAIQTSELFKVSSETAREVLLGFTGLKAHQELIKKIDGIEFYNDAASVTPLATLCALRKLSFNKNVVLIMGGAYTGYDYSELIKSIPEFVSSVILLPGSGSLGFRSELEKLEGVRFHRSPTLEEAVILAKGEAKKGDRVIFSPGCEALGVHISRKERGEKFVKAVRGL
jgi:UDP-N-acetylmuramoylalanine--D-glutamate ligase